MGRIGECSPVVQERTEEAGEVSRLNEAQTFTVRHANENLTNDLNVCKLLGNFLWEFSLC